MYTRQAGGLAAWTRANQRAAAGDIFRRQNPLMCPSVEMVPVHVTERVCLTPEPPQKHCYKSCCEYEQGHRYIEDVRYVLGLSQVHYLTSYIHNPDCTSRPEYHISAVRCEPRHKPRRWLSTVILYPKRPVRSYTSTVEYSMRPTSRKWYMTKLDMAVGDEENNIVATNMLYFPKRRTPSFWSFFVTDVNNVPVGKKFEELNNFKIKRDWRKQLSLQVMA
ncbi:refilin-B-like isoform X1 [Branchiostoma lanceolatum]|uniref:refilin-B-like isoform X1 n=2 Tax=Branchiostoma lanceolatum TaxID=7740 RepID=UPI0034568AD0